MVRFAGLELTFIYPKFSRMSGENVTVTVSDGKSSATISILTHVVGVFWVDPLADIALSEGTPVSVDIAPAIHDPAAKVLTVTTDSSHVTVNGTTLKYLYPVGSGILEENVTIKVSDGTAVNDTSVRLKVTITPVFPTVAIIAPAPGWSAPGKFKATGTASISAGTISKVEIKIDDGDWKVASGTDVWELDIDITGMTTGVHYIYVRASAGDATSEVATSRFVLEPGGTKEVNTAGSLMLGLAIGLILAIILAIVMYMVGRKGAKGGEEEGRMAAKGGRRAYSEDVEEEEGGQDDEGYDDEDNDRSGGNASRQEEAEGKAGHYYNEKEAEQGTADGGGHGHDDQDNNMGEDDGYGGEAFGDAPSKRRR